MLTPGPANASYLTLAFLDELKSLGYVEGQNISIERRFAEGNLARMPALAAELVQQRVELIIAATVSAAQAAKDATTTIPIVFWGVGDPVRSGLVTSLARPGGNLTGTSRINPDVAAKRLQLLKEIDPKISRTAVLDTPVPYLDNQLMEIGRAAKILGIEILGGRVEKQADWAEEETRLRKWRADSIYVVETPANFFNRHLLVDFTLALRLPAIFGSREYIESRGLMCYGESLERDARRAAIYADKILKGANPGLLPVEQPTVFELIVNLRTARTLGITVPQSVLLRADSVLD